MDSLRSERDALQTPYERSSVPLTPRNALGPSVYGCTGIYTLARQVTDSCIICKKTNKQALKKIPLGGRTPRLRPFQSVQVDYTEILASRLTKIPISDSRPSHSLGRGHSFLKGHCQ